MRGRIFAEIFVILHVDILYPYRKQMKLRLTQFIISGLLAAGLLASCNTKTSDEPTASSTAASSSTLVTSFSLKANNKLIYYLDSVYFSIDQVKANIFNADSLPWGTDVRKLQVVIGAPASASAVEIIMPSLYDGHDTIVNYLTNPNDSINFSRGSVWLRINSQSGNEERVYTLKVNVHQTNADSLQWAAEPRQLPSTLSPRPSAQKAVEFNDKFYCLTANSLGNKQISISENPLADAWTTSDITADIDPSTLTATTDALYALSASGGKLLSSTDGATWTETGSEGWTWIYGGYDSQVIGAKGSSRWAAYPSGTEGAIPSGMPVSATSQMWTYTDEWFITPQAILIGGVTADGTESGDAWGFDGTNWGRLSARNALPAGSDYTLFPYFTYRTGDRKFFIVSRHSCWVAFGAHSADKVSKEVYVSLDNGVNWRKAPQGMQLPEGITARYGASALLTDREFSSRAVKPITDWDAPYVLLFGGMEKGDKLADQLWIGAINRLTFKPLQ